MSRKIHSVILILLLQLVSVGSANAQNKMSLLRYNDDFTQFKADSTKKGLQQLKYISLGQNTYISFGGELREQFQHYNNLNFADVPPTFPDITPNQLWHRLLMHSNIEIGTKLRLFVQVNNTLRFINKNPVAPEIDENQPSLHQALAEVNMNRWKIRVGRQECFMVTTA